MRRLAAIVVAVATLIALSFPVVSAGADTQLSISVVSNRADLVSGGDALIEVSPPAPMTVTLNGRDVTADFATRANGRYQGVVTGLDVGSNVLTAAAGDQGATITIINHPAGGPVFAGRQVQPWICAAGTTGPQCQAPTTFSWFYKSVLTGRMTSYDPANPPPAAEVAMTTTTDGVTVPYIVRQEEGTKDRGFYKIIVLADPQQPWSRWKPYRGWNQKAVYAFGGGSNPNYSQQPTDGILLKDNALANGFLIVQNSLNVHGHSTNDTVSAEAVVMMKEHILDTYGDVRYTVAVGCSGGAMGQFLTSNNYPGLLDALIPSCSFPDLWSEATEIADCYLLNHYFSQAAPLLWPNPAQQNAVRGKGPDNGCAIWDATYFSLLDPTDAGSFKNCGLPSADIYHPQTNPTGVRCTIQDYQVSVWGVRPPSRWGPVEKEIGRGFAQRPYDNVAVMYGLTPLLDGQISADQFLDLNRHIGGLDIDAVPVANRTAADAGALKIAYRSGQIADGRQWAHLPIIDLRGHSTSEWHQDYNSYQTRARLDAANGGHDNQVIWTGEFPVFGNPAFGCDTTVGLWLPTSTCTALPLLAMDRWMTKIQADSRPGTLAQKVIRNRSEDIVDTCWIGGVRTTDMQTCLQAFPYYGSPRMAAGDSIRNDILKCTLKPLRRADFPGVTFTDDQWATLGTTFPRGVCDWSKPGVGQRPGIPWMTFADGPGGEPLPPPPTSFPFRERR